MQDIAATTSKVITTVITPVLTIALPEAPASDDDIGAVFSDAAPAVPTTLVGSVSFAALVPASSAPPAKPASSAAWGGPTSSSAGSASSSASDATPTPVPTHVVVIPTTRETVSTSTSTAVVGSGKDAKTIEVQVTSDIVESMSFAVQIAPATGTDVIATEVPVAAVVPIPGADGGLTTLVSSSSLYLSRLGGGTLSMAPTGGVAIVAGGSDSLTLVTTISDVLFTTTGITTVTGADNKPTPSTFTSTGTTQSVFTTTRPKPTTTATSKTPERQTPQRSKAPVAKIVAGVVIGVITLTAIAIFLWYRRRRAMFTRMRRAGHDLLDTENINDKYNQRVAPGSFGMSAPSIYAERSLQDARAEGTHNVLVLSALEQGDSPPAGSRRSDIHRGVFQSSSQVSIPQSQLGDFKLSSKNLHTKGTSNSPDHHHLNLSKFIRARVKNQSREDHSKVVAMPVVLSGPDPEREIVRAQQQWMLEKNAAEHAQRLAAAEAVASTAARAPGSTSNATGLPQVPEDYELLRAQVMMLQQRMEEMTAATNRERGTEDELPPAYEGRRST